MDGERVERRLSRGHANALLPADLLMGEPRMLGHLGKVHDRGKAICGVRVER